MASDSIPPAKRSSTARDRGLQKIRWQGFGCTHYPNPLAPTMLASISTSSALTNGAPTILQFPSEPGRSVRSLRNMTAQLLQEAAKVIPNQQLLINVVSKRVRQLGIGHRPLVEATPKSSLTDIALKEIIAGKLTYEELKDVPAEA
jgi:DNA-directed RNA polymerase subunit omega